MRRRVCGLTIVLVGLLLLPATVSAQDEAGISGTVLDNTGGLLPGVTIVATGPAVLAPRTAFTDGAGLFAITALPAGTYTVTFTLQGFTTLVREGIVLEGAFTANVDAEMAVGSVQETVTVTGQAPLVDVVSTRSQEGLAGGANQRAARRVEHHDRHAVRAGGARELLRVGPDASRLGCTG